jgi:hypothetical protein
VAKSDLDRTEKESCRLMNAHSVDHRIRYIPALISIAATVHIQNNTSIVVRSQGPVFGTPYWQMFMRIVPIL